MFKRSDRQRGEGSEEHWRNRQDADQNVDQLMGLAQGIIMDGVVTEEEAKGLSDWLERHDVADHPVVVPLAMQLKEFMRDGVLDDDEAAAFKETLLAFTGGTGEGGEEYTTAALPVDEECAIVFAGMVFVLTGTFNMGTRKTVTTLLRETGASVESNVTKRTNFLVLGHYVTPAWRHKSFGRKIEKALEYRAVGGVGLKIVGERDLQAALNP